MKVFHHVWKTFSVYLCVCVCVYVCVCVCIYIYIYIYIYIVLPLAPLQVSSYWIEILAAIERMYVNNSNCDS